MIFRVHLSLTLVGALLGDGAGVGVVRGGEVFGVVRDVVGPGISNLMVRAEVFDSSSYTQMVVTTDAEGRFSFSGPPGSWNVAPDRPTLNALGYLDLQPAWLSVTNGSQNVRFTTRKLDLSRRLIGSLVDDFHFPLPSFPLRAFIQENGQQYETNTFTGVDGGFSLGVSPALWRIEPFWTAGTTVLFPELDVAVESTNNETSITVVAPRVTVSISGVASNLAGFEILAECQAHGRRFVQSTRLWERQWESFSLPVFPGLWTVTVTNRGYRILTGWIPPSPVIVTITNGSVELSLAGSRATPSPELFQVRAMTAEGTPVTNASIYAYNEHYQFSSPLPIAPSPTPMPNAQALSPLSLGDGRWTVNASISDPSNAWSWQVSRTVEIPGLVGSNLDLVIPAQGVGPRILGLVREVSGARLGGVQVALRAFESGTNYSGWVTTDTNGQFAVNVVPGRWRLSPFYWVPCPTVSTATVANADQTVELVVCPLPLQTNLPVNVTVAEEGAPPARDFQVSFSSWASFVTTPAVTGQPVTTPLSLGLWNVSLSADWSSFRNDPYELFPTLKFHHSGISSPNLTLLARQASARIQGRLRDTQGHLLTTGYASARANIGGTIYSVNAQVASGYFSLNVIPGDWEVAASTWRYPGNGGRATPSRPGFEPRPRYKDPLPQLIRMTNGLLECEFVVESLPASLIPLTIKVVREGGSPVENATVLISADSADGWAVTDSDGMVQVEAPPGTNVVSAYWSWQAVPWEELLFPSMVFEVSSPSNHLVLVARSPTTCLSGTLSNASGQALPLSVRAETRVNGTNYSIIVCSQPSGGFCLPVFPGVWQVSIPEGAANDLGFQSHRGQEVTVPASGEPGSVHFLLQLFDGDFRQAQWLPPTVGPGGAVQLELRAQAALTWRAERSADLKAWEPWTTITTSNGVARISDPEPPVESRYYRAVWLR